MAGNEMEKLLMEDSSSSDDDDERESDETLQQVAVSSEVPAAAAIAATVKVAQPPPPAPAPAPATTTTTPTTSTPSDLSSRLKSLYSPASKASLQQKKVSASGPGPRPAVSQGQHIQIPGHSVPPVQQQQQARSTTATNIPPAAVAAGGVRTAPMKHPPVPTQQVPQRQQQQQQRTSSSSSSSSTTTTTAGSGFRPLVPNRGAVPAGTAPPMPQQQQTHKRPSASSDPFEPTPLKTMIQRQQQKAAQQAAAASKQHSTIRTPPTVIPPHPSQQQQQQHQSAAMMRSTNSSASTVSTTSSASTTMASNVATTTTTAAAAERDAKHRKERFLMFTRVLMKYLEQKDPAMHVKAKAVIRECAEKNKKKEAGYESVTASMQKRLKAMVGQNYWTRAEAYLNHFLKQKDRQGGGGSSGQQQHPQQHQGKSSTSSSQAAAQSISSKASSSSSQSQSLSRSSVSKPPTKTPEQIAKERQVAEATQKNLENIQREKEKIRQQQAELHKRKLEEEKRNVELKKAQRQKEMAAARMASVDAAKQQQQQAKKKKDQSRKSTSSSSAASRMSPMVSSADKKEKSTPPAPPPREYSELMQMIDHAVDYDWTSAALLLGSDLKADVVLNGEQKRLLYGHNLAPPRPAPARRPSSLDLPASLRGWGRRNVLSSRGAWARVRLREQREQLASAKQNSKAPVVAGLTLPSDPNKANATDSASLSSSSTVPVLTPEVKWFNEEKAEKDMTLALMSEATQVYLKSVLQKAIAAARQRENLDGVRLWHLQHGPSKPPMSLRLGCDVSRQVAQAEGNAAKTVQRMEEALERQRHVPAKVRDLENAETLYNASSMSDLSLRPLLVSGAEDAEANAKRSFDVYGGKYTAAPPFGRVPKRPKVTKRDLVMAQEWNDYGHQKKGIASPHII